VRVILGIGNPGPAYAFTRHNVGWFVLDALVGSQPERQWKPASGPYLEASVAFGDSPCVLIKPLTYVNRSGEAALAVGEQYGVAPSEFLIVVDDVHLPLGDLRMRQGGSSGGHNGLISLEQSLGTQKVPRLRVGIGAPLQSGALVTYVLSPFTPEEESIVRRIVRDAAVIAEAFGRGGYAEAATAYSQWKLNASSACLSSGPSITQDDEPHA